MSARPLRPGQDAATIAAFKKLPTGIKGSYRPRSEGQADRNLVPRRGTHRPEERDSPAVGKRGTRPRQLAHQRF